MTAENIVDTKLRHGINIEKTLKQNDRKNAVNVRRKINKLLVANRGESIDTNIDIIDEK